MPRFYLSGPRKWNEPELTPIQQILAGAEQVLRQRVVNAEGKKVRPDCPFCKRGLGLKWSHCEGCKRPINWVEP